MREAIQNFNIDVETVSVDSAEIKERLLNDDQYGIDRVPAILIVYTTGQYKLYIDSLLDEWFIQLLQNVQQQSPAPQETEQSPHEEYTPIDFGIEEPSPQPPETGMSAAHTAMINEHIKDSGSRIPISSEPLVQPSRKEVKTDAVSPAELAKQMVEQRERHDEEIEDNRPFI